VAEQLVVKVFAKQALSNARRNVSKKRSQAQGRGACIIAVSAYRRTDELVN